MPEFTKLDAGAEGFLSRFPMACVCGSQKGPVVDTFIDRRDEHIYLCRLCTTRAARALGLVKGDEFTRLQNAADELGHMQSEVDSRQEIIDRQIRAIGEKEQKIATLQQYIEQLQAEATHYKAFANQMAGMAKEMVTA